MANIQNSIFAYGLTRSGKIVIANNPMFDDHRKVSNTKKSLDDALQEAVTYATFASHQEVYINRAQGIATTAYTIALADWFGGPKVLEINVDNWTGEIGQTIRVKARDNVMVARVMVVIRDAKENVLEAGDATQTQEGSPWWKYTTQSQIRMTPFPIVEVTAQDLPGNTDSFAIR
jgi:hypothetical protein